MSLKQACLTILAYSLLAYALDVMVPFNVNLYESYIPGPLADKLILKSNPEDNYYYERLLIDRRHQNGTDEYICEFAPVTYLKLEENTEEEEEPEHEMLRKATQLIHLTFDKSSCVWAYDFRGWYWTYAFCFGDKVIQYHEGAAHSSRPNTHKPIAPSTVFVLGRFTNASAKKVNFENQISDLQYKSFVENAGRSYRLLDEKASPFSHHSSQKVILQTVTDGTTCDMTRQPRSMELVYACSEMGGDVAEIINVEEIRTCHYKMVLHIPKLCQYEPFVPTKQVQDSLVDVACQKIDRANTYNDAKSSFDDYLGVTLLREDEDFPVRPDNRINIALHDILDLRGGFYIATHDYEYISTSEYFNNRCVALFNGEFTHLEDLNYQFGRAVFNSMGKSFLAPSSTPENPIALDWLHKFVLWFEIYSITGEFIALSRIENTSDGDQPALNALIVDPVDLVEMNGDQPLFARFQRPEFQAPHNLWNFEIFSEDLEIPYEPHKRIKYSRDISGSSESAETKAKQEHEMAEVNQEEQKVKEAQGLKEEEIHEKSQEKAQNPEQNEKGEEEYKEEQNPPIITETSHREGDSEGNPHFVEVDENQQMYMEYQ